MVAQKNGILHKGDTSETELISGTESFSSDQGHKDIIDASLSLENLFNELSQESKNANQVVIDEDDEFRKIQKSISKLPKLESNLEENMNKEVAATKKINDITRINDPIIHKPKKSDEGQLDSGSKWFNMKQPELTPSITRDLSIIKQRNALDPKRHYKKDKWEIPKFFQMGTVVEGNTEFYSARMSRRERGNTLVEEVLNDSDRKKYFKRKYTEIQDKKTSGGKNHYKKVKSMRKKY
ncbi:unnamed protein product [Debaryomyces fabryi]|nr:unnamed protein product [Debaryomyces fabryi]